MEKKPKLRSRLKDVLKEFSRSFRAFSYKKRLVFFLSLSLSCSLYCSLCLGLSLFYQPEIRIFKKWGQKIQKFSYISKEIFLTQLR